MEMSGEMETLLHFNDSTTDSAGFFYSTYTTTRLDTLNDSFKWTHEEIARLIQIIVRPILIIIGAVGNCLSFYIMRRTTLKEGSSCFLYVTFGSGRYK